MLYYGYSEEMLAHDMYMYFYELYGVNTFQNIANSELEHMTAVKALLDRYELDIPTDYGELSDEFDALKAEWEESLQKALEVWIKIEMLDIEDIAETIRTTDNDDFKIMFTNIGGASYNHLRGFVSWLANNWLTTDIDYSEYLSEEEVATKWGALKTKMAEKLEAEGVELPEQAKSSTIKENCDNEAGQQGQAQWKGMWKNNDKANYNKYANNSILKAKYKNAYAIKYGSIIGKMSDDKIESFVWKIDDLVVKVNNSTASDLTKEKYNAMLMALREIALENLDEDDSLLDSLFE